MEFWMTFHIAILIGNVIIQADELIFFRGVGSTTNQILIIYWLSAWWFGTKEFYIILWLSTNWRNHICQRGWNHQPVIYWLLLIDDWWFIICFWFWRFWGFEHTNFNIWWLAFFFLLYVTLITLSQIPGFFKTLGHLFWWNIPVDGVSGQLQLTVVVSPAGHLP